MTVRESTRLRRPRRPTTPKFPKKNALKVMTHEFERLGLEFEVVQALRTASSDLVRAIQPTTDIGSWFDGLREAAASVAPIVHAHVYADFKLWAAELRSRIDSSKVGGGISLADWKAASQAAMQVASDAPITYRGLVRVRDYQGPAALFDLLGNGQRVVRLSPHEARYSMYVSQAFFEHDKVTRALHGAGLDDPLPALVRVREDDGFLNFVLADGHHRALVRYAHNQAQLLRPDPNLVVAQHKSFRLYIRQNHSKLP